MLKSFFLITVLVFFNCLRADAALIEKNAVVAVMDFGTHAGAASSDVALANAEGTTSEYVITKLINDGKLVVMDKENVRSQLEANNVKLVGLIDPDSAKVIGSVLHCQYIIYGNVNDVSVSNTGTKMLGPIGGDVNVCTVKSHVIARIMNVADGTIVMAAKGEGVSKSSYTDLHTLKGGIRIGTVTVTQESVHNALQKAAFNAVDILTQRLYGQK
ncbi:CsgG/HfaB family protein [Phascolarctobacterium succinatutens]|uniref:CsgG/HfaB family protein n=1 Tax=Phascolarctobacterium succinatutens TaxID=626940 RepID=UPI0026EC468B|nr:CsgG/HfaB family protein [Phascolarctobacterium succinatutens]